MVAHLASRMESHRAEPLAVPRANRITVSLDSHTASHPHTANPASHTGRYLRPYLEAASAPAQAKPGRKNAK